jgi:pimeloyl-ACP methyl ester carboxylesterase
MMKPTSIVFITGTFLGNNCWQEWQYYFERNGYRCIAPAWPHKGDTPEVLRNRHPDFSIASNSLQTLIDFHASLIATLPGESIAIGHSLGGLIVQLLIQQGLIGAGVAIHSFPLPGVCQYNFSFLKELWKPVDLLSDMDQTYMMPFNKWQRTIANGMTYDQQKAYYYLYATPESKRVVRDVFSCMTNINLKDSHAPLLLTSGSQDKIVPSTVSHCNYKAYNDKNSITAFKEFKGHNHFVFSQSSLTEEADFISFWLNGLNK